MRVSRFARVAFAALTLALFITGAAFAQAPNNPVGLWSFQAHDDTTPALAALGNQDICFLANGTWFSPTFAGWSGLWFQKGNNAAGNGNRIRLLGNFSNGLGNDSAEIDFANLNLLTGPWNQWTDDRISVLWTRVVGTRLGNLCPVPEPGVIVEDTTRTPWKEKAR